MQVAQTSIKDVNVEKSSSEPLKKASNSNISGWECVLEHDVPVASSCLWILGGKKIVHILSTTPSYIPGLAFLLDFTFREIRNLLKPTEERLKLNEVVNISLKSSIIGSSALFCSKLLFDQTSAFSSFVNTQDETISLLQYPAIKAVVTASIFLTAFTVGVGSMIFVDKKMGFLHENIRKIVNYVTCVQEPQVNEIDSVDSKTNKIAV